MVWPGPDIGVVTVAPAGGRCRQCTAQLVSMPACAARRVEPFHDLRRPGRLAA